MNRIHFAIPLSVAECFSEWHASCSRRRGRGGRRPLRRAMKLTCAVKLYSVGSSAGARARAKPVELSQKLSSKNLF